MIKKSKIQVIVSIAIDQEVEAIAVRFSKMTTDNEKISRAVDETLKEIAKNAPDEFAKLSADQNFKDDIIKAARKAAKEEVKLAREFSSQPDIRQRLAKYLPEDRIKLIEESLLIPTFRVEITTKSDGKYRVEFTREGEVFLPGRELTTLADIEATSLLQKASIIVEAVMLVMQVVGIKVSVSESAMRATVEDTVKAIEHSSEMQKAIQAFITSWNEAGGSAMKKARAIFFLLKDSYTAGILWTIIKSLCRDMTWADWLKTAAEVSAMLVASLLTDGAALIAKIALVVMAAVDFAKKLHNLAQLEEIKQTLREEHDPQDNNSAGCVCQ
ncbi:uncharacterized protein [Montipora capricornis]|uniref:uncharacterized protein isoform X2 n=1 Tax=Montipora foliosa TaxID=591990 RepID=UPI0035F206BA